MKKDKYGNPNPYPIKHEAREILADSYEVNGLKNVADWIRAGQADNSTHTPALEALSKLLNGDV